jgi:DNA replication protein DnaC
LANVIEDLVPAAWHNTGQYQNNRIECDHGRLKARLRPMRGLKTHRMASVVIRGHAFIQNLRRGHYELAVDSAQLFRLATRIRRTQARRLTSAGPRSCLGMACDRTTQQSPFEAWTPEVSSIPAPTQQALRTLEWVGRRENLVVCGPSGTGKTFLLEALGHQVVEAGLKVAWFTLEDLRVLLRRHRADDTVTKAIARVLRADLVVVDNIGLLPVAQGAAEGLYRLVDAAYEKRSVALSSNLHPAAFDELMPKTLATATVDRLLHHAHICQTTGESVRLTQALAGQGVSPLS